MTFDDFITHCESKNGTEQTIPFGPDTLVLKVGNKMYALCSLKEFKSINLKCDPEKAIELRERYPAVIPGYHMSKVHWNTVEMDGSISDKIIKEWIDDSYDLIVASLPKKERGAL